MTISDFKGRKLTLYARIAKKPEGSRYVTRISVKNVLLGKSNRVKGGSDHINAKKHWPAKATLTRLKIGCHIFTGYDFNEIKNWALR